jgi:hypothetical protein
MGSNVRLTSGDLDVRCLADGSDVRTASLVGYIRVSVSLASKS